MYASESLKNHFANLERDLTHTNTLIDELDNFDSESVFSQIFTVGSMRESGCSVVNNSIFINDEAERELMRQFLLDVRVLREQRVAKANENKEELLAQAEQIDTQMKDLKL